MKIITVLFFTLITAVLAGCGKSSSPEIVNPEIEECVARGLAYFVEIGSYPVLTTEPNVGRKASEVARERCDRTTGAF